MCVDLDERQQEMHFFTGGSVIIDSKQRFEAKTWSFCLLQMLSDGLVWIIVMFISCLDSHSDGTHSLQSIHYWDWCNATFLQIWWRNKLIVTVCVFGICCIVSCVLLSPPSLYFLVFDRLSNDVVQVRHWWFGWGGIFIIQRGAHSWFGRSWIPPPADDQTYFS